MKANNDRLEAVASQLDEAMSWLNEWRENIERELPF